MLLGDEHSHYWELHLLGRTTSNRNNIPARFIINHSILPESFRIAVVSVIDGSLDEWPLWKARNMIRLGFDKLSMKLPSARSVLDG